MREGVVGRHGTIDPTRDRLERLGHEIEEHNFGPRNRAISLIDPMATGWS